MRALFISVALLAVPLGAQDIIIDPMNRFARSWNTFAAKYGGENST